MPRPTHRAQQGSGEASLMNEHRVALVGSTGGSTLRGGALSQAEALAAQLPPGVALTTLTFVEAATPLDRAGDSTPATLWRLDDAGRPYCCVSSTLAEVNREARRLDAALAQAVRAGEVDALVLVSASLGAAGVNRKSLDAACATRTPCLGTGGSGLGLAVEAGAHVLSLSGSVATTADSRAIAAAAALARYWRLPFTPRPQGSGGARGQGSQAALHRARATRRAAAVAAAA
jgi:hypothetical protein